MLIKKRIGIIFLCVIALTAFTIPGLAVVPGQINYQGQLTDDMGVQVPDGTYTMRFYLFDAQTGGSSLWNSTLGEEQSVDVTDGIYNVLLGAIEPLSSMIFDSDEVWLEVSILHTPSSTWEKMSPRQPVTSVAYALKAGDADTLEGRTTADLDARYIIEGQANSITSAMIGIGEVNSHDIADNSLTAMDLATNSVAAAEIAASSVGTSEIANGSITSEDLQDGAVLAEILDDDGPGSGLNADRLDGYSSTSFVLNSQDYGRYGVATNLFEGNTTLGNKYVNQTGGDVMSGSLTTNILRVDNNAIAGGGDAIYARTYSETGIGVLGFAMNNGAFLNKGGHFIAYGGQGYGVYGLAGNGGDYENYGGYFKANGRYGRGIYASASGASGVGIWADSAGSDATAVFSNIGYGPLIKGFGSNGGEDEFRINNDGTMIFYNNNHTRTIQIDPSESGTTNGGQITLYDDNGAITIEIDGDYNGDGRITTQELQITGGSDLSEQFDIEDILGKVKPGMVVSIDEKWPGKLKISDSSYDSKVAGIISGAGGIKPGMMMGQKGSKADGAHPVALTGRVYCWAETSTGKIQPGDLLTTSDIPGHAMKVTENTRAFGAIIGKAMTPLEEGKGLVLVLVSLQ